MSLDINLTGSCNPAIRDYSYRAGNYAYWIISEGKTHQVLEIKFNEKTKTWEISEK